MRKILISSALVLSLASGGAALAATKAATPKAAPAASATDSKATECGKQWKAEKKHTETRKAFMAACSKA